MNEKVKRSIRYGTPIILFLYLYVSNLWYLTKNGIRMVNSDTASEMILADLLNKTGGVITDQWFYSTELRVLNTQLIYRLALLLSPNDWNVAKVISVSVFLLILALGTFLLFRELDRPYEGLFAACVAICPIGQWYGWNVIYHSYYVPHIAISLFCLIFFCHLLKYNDPQNELLSIFMLSILGFTSCLGGLRQLLICFCPMLLTFIFMIWDDREDFVKVKYTIRKLVLFSISCMAAILGYLVNSKILTKTYYFDSNSSRYWEKFNLPKVLECLGEFMCLFGWQEKARIMSLGGVTNVLCLVCAIVSLFSVLYLFLHRRKVLLKERALIVFILIMFLLSLLIYSTSASNESYWTLVLPFILFSLIIFISILKDKITKTLLYIGLTVVLLFGSISTMRNPYISWVPDDRGLLNAAQWIEESGYSQGIATFWNSNVITGITNGKVEMWTVDSFDLHLYKWLQKTSHDQSYPEGSFFVLSGIDESGNSELQVEGLLDRVVYKDDYVYIVLFDSIEQYYELTGFGAD